MLNTFIRTKRGFTLIELLVVIAIIGILSSVVLASLSSARLKARDSKRVSDLDQIRVALEMYFDANGTYPIEGTAATYEADTLLQSALSPTYLPSFPVAPNSGEKYIYRSSTSNTTYTACAAVANQPCLGWVLGANLEQTSAQNPVLRSDADTAWTGGAANFTGADTAGCLGGAPTNRYCYDIRG